MSSLPPLPNSQPPPLPSKAPSSTPKIFLIVGSLCVFGTIALFGALSLIKQPGDSLLQEALAQTKPLLNTKWYNKGDSWFTLNQYGGSAIVRSPLYIQARKVTHTYQPFMVSEADRLNGIEWRGNIFYRCDVYRTFDRATSKWSDWRDGSSLYSDMPHFTLTKTHGKWESEGGNPLVSEKPSAEEISAILNSQ